MLQRDLGSSSRLEAEGRLRSRVRAWAAGIGARNDGDRVSFELEADRRGRGKQAAQLKKI